MSKNIVFKNKGLLSLIDLTTMGDSSKRRDVSKIGKFDSGLKYALALLVRNEIQFEIFSGSTRFTVGTTISHDETTKKSKELMVINERKILKEPNDDVCNSCKGTGFGEYPNNTQKYQCEGSYCKEALINYSDDNSIEHITAFSPQLGYDWELWQAFRELYANTLDEKGIIEFVDVNDEQIPASDNETVIRIFSHPLVEDIINHWNDYFLPVDLEPLTSYGSGKIYKNPNGTLKLYKQGILIYKDEDVKSRYIYSYEYASIDEKRVLNDLYSFKNNIVNTIVESYNVEFLREFLSDNNSELFESKLDFYTIYSEELIDVANELYKEGILAVSNSMKDAIMKHSKSDIGILKLRHTSFYDYSSEEVAPTAYKDAEEEVVSKIKQNFEEKIVSLAATCNIKIKHKITESNISGFKVMADSFRRTLFVDSNFEIADMWQLVKAIYSLDKDRDAIFKDFINLKQK